MSEDDSVVGCSVLVSSVYMANLFRVSLVLAVDRRSIAKDRIFARDRSAIYTSVILIASGRSAIFLLPF